MLVLKWNLPAPHKPVGLRPECMESFFIRCTIRKAVIDTSWVFAPNCNLLAKRIIYKQGSVKMKEFNKTK